MSVLGSVCTNSVLTNPAGSSTGVSFNSVESQIFPVSLAEISASTPLRLSLQSISSVLQALAGLSLASRMALTDPAWSAMSSSVSFSLELAVDSSSSLVPSRCFSGTSAMLTAPVL